MSLDPLHEWVARIVFDLPQARDIAIAGGNAMLAHHLVVRPTQDLDLFTPVPSEVDPLVVALAEALRAHGARVGVDRRGPGFSRLTVETVEGRHLAVEIAHDARLRPSVQLEIGRVLHPDEVAADKTLALFGRAAARDLVDVAALTNRYSLQQLCDLAAEKDAGFDPRVLADAMNAAAEHPNDAFAELGLSEEATNRLRSKVLEWRASLLMTDIGSEDATHPSPVPTKRTPAPAIPPPSTRPRRAQHDLQRPNDHGREGPSMSR